MAAATITIDGATATLSGVSVPAAQLRGCLTFLHPGRFYNRAFQQRRWDGTVKLFDGASFASGFAARVSQHLRDQGIACRILARGGGKIEPTADFGEGYLPGVQLWKHQLEAIRTLLAKSRGVLAEPTGSGKTAIMAAACRLFYEQKGWRSLIVVPKRGIAAQTRDAFRRFIPAVDIGLVSDGHREDGQIIITTAQSMIGSQPRGSGRKKKPGDEWLAERLHATDVLFLDECHHGSSTQWQEIASDCPALRRYGVSGTPLSGTELSDVKLEGQTGPVIHLTTSSDLIEAGIVAHPKIAMVMADEASQPKVRKVAKLEMVRGRARASMQDPDYRMVYDTCLSASSRHNSAVTLAVRWLLEQKRRVLVLCRIREHFAYLERLLTESGVKLAALCGDTPMAERDEAKRAFADKEIDCLLATTIFDEGEDVRGIDAIVLAEGVTAITSILQRIGRGMRRDSDDVWVVDFVPLGSKLLTEHARKRCTVYEDAGFGVEVVEDWPARASSPPKDLLPFLRWESADATG